MNRCIALSEAETGGRQVYLESKALWWSHHAQVDLYPAAFGKPSDLGKDPMDELLYGVVMTTCVICGTSIAAKLKGKEGGLYCERCA